MLMVYSYYMVSRGVEMLRKPRVGYTILEVLVFLVISSFILIAALGTVNGRQQQVQFTQSVREFESKIADTINDVTTGYYPTNTDLSCSVGVFATDRPTIKEDTNNSNSGVGTNSQCLYVGKALQFAPSDQDATKFYIYTLAGRRYGLGTTTVKNINEALPVAVAADPIGSFNDSIELAELRYGVEVTKVFENGSPLNGFGVIGIMSKFENGGSLTGTSNSQSVQIGGIKSAITRRNASQEDAVSLINLLTLVNTETEGYINTNTDGIVICLKGSGGRKASVTLGAKGSSTTLLQIDDYNGGCNLI